jgi:carbamate kinase
MRILLSLGESPRSAATAAAIAEIVAGHEALVIHRNPPPADHGLELALRNALPGRDVVSVLTQVVVASDPSALEPQAIAEIRSVRVLLDSGALVICAGENSVPVVLDELGTMHEVDAPVDPDLTAALLARRIDADLLMLPVDPLDGSGSREAKAEAAARFRRATGRQALVGSLAEMAEALHGGTLAA